MYVKNISWMLSTELSPGIIVGSTVGAVCSHNGLLRLPGGGGGAERERETHTDGQEPAGSPETSDSDQNEGECPPCQEIP